MLAMKTIARKAGEGRWQDGISRRWGIMWQGAGRWLWRAVEEQHLEANQPTCGLNLIACELHCWDMLKFEVMPFYSQLPFAAVIFRPTFEEDFEYLRLHCFRNRLGKEVCCSEAILYLWSEDVLAGIFFQTVHPAPFLLQNWVVFKQCPKRSSWALYWKAITMLKQSNCFPSLYDFL